MPDPCSGRVSAYGAQTLHTSKHKPSREPRRRGTFERHPAPMPGAPWHLGPVLEPASRPRPSPRVPQHSCLVKRESRRGQMLRLSQPFLILEFVALTLRSINTRFAILKFSHVSVWVLSFMLKPCSPPSPAIFPARTPGCRGALRRCSSGAAAQQDHAVTARDTHTPAYLICDTRAGKLLWRRGSEKTRFSNRCLLCSSQVT